MEFSTELYVGDTGLVRINYDSHLREEITIPVYGVHEAVFGWMWNPVKGPPKSPTAEWLKTEDGMQFTEEMNKKLDTFPPGYFEDGEPTMFDPD